MKAQEGVDVSREICYTLLRCLANSVAVLHLAAICCCRYRFLTEQGTREAVGRHEWHSQFVAWREMVAMLAPFRSAATAVLDLTGVSSDGRMASSL